MKTTKQIFAILLTVIVIATTLIACKRNEDSEPVNATEPAPVETVDEIVDNLTEDVNIEDTTTDENGNNVVIGTDDDGNTVEIKTDNDGNITKTITDKNTGEKTTTTTKKTETTTKKNTATTTKKATVTTTKPTTKAPTTTKKPVTTTKPATTKAPTTTKHTHNYNIPVYAEKQVLVKAAWDEDIYETKYETKEHRVCGNCGLDYSAGYKALGYSSETAYAGKHARATGHSKSHTEYETITTKVKVNTVHHPAEYKTEKYIAGYKCTCGAKK